MGLWVAGMASRRGGTELEGSIRCLGRFREVIVCSERRWDRDLSYRRISMFFRGRSQGALASYLDLLRLEERFDRKLEERRELGTELKKDCEWDRGWHGK